MDTPLRPRSWHRHAAIRKACNERRGALLGKPTLACSASPRRFEHEPAAAEWDRFSRRSYFRIEDIRTHDGSGGGDGTAQ